MNTYAVCSKVIPNIPAIAPNKGPKCAEAGGRSLVAVEGFERRRHVNSFKMPTAFSEAPVGSAELNDRSHIERRARPCATEVRRPTVHIMAASRVSSSFNRSPGHLCAASTNGRVVEA